MGKMQMVITQKIHGTNACVVIIPNETGELEIRAQSRTRFVYIGDDNYGFAAWVDANKAELVETLGPGYHYGEWAGIGINSGEGLTEKIFVLFDFWKFPVERPLPKGCVVVPILYQGAADLAEVEKAMEDLKTNGSKLAPGFMRPEGVVITLAGTRYKKVFDDEETQWTKGSGSKAPKVETKFTLGHLLQPIRLEKLMSKDERYTRDYPATLPQIAADYVKDLVEEGQIVGDDGQIKAIKKQLSGELFKFIRSQVNL
jgi:hypothetical protein